MLKIKRKLVFKAFGTTNVFMVLNSNLKQDVYR